MRCRRAPCDECPWRRDVPEGLYPVIPSTAAAVQGGPGAEAPMDAPIVACHKSPEGDDLPCAGWLAVAGVDHLGVRLAVAQGRIPPEALRPGEDWPELVDSFAEMVARHG